LLLVERRHFQWFRNWSFDGERQAPSEVGPSCGTMENEALLMLANRSKDAWILVAIAAITLASLARAQAGIENARTYASPVVKFFAGSPLTDATVSKSTDRNVSSVPRYIFGTALDLLAVSFVGLVSPLGLQSVRSLHAMGRALPAPNLSALFQRPPPALLA
jgi:hypothetical protein